VSNVAIFLQDTGEGKELEVAFKEASTKEENNMPAYAVLNKASDDKSIGIINLKNLIVKL